MGGGQGYGMQTFSQGRGMMHECGGVIIIIVHGF